MAVGDSVRMYDASGPGSRPGAVDAVYARGTVVCFALAVTSGGAVSDVAESWTAGLAVSGPDGSTASSSGRDVRIDGPAGVTTDGGGGAIIPPPWAEDVSSRMLRRAARLHPPRRPEGSSALSPSDVAASLVEERDAVLGISPRPPPGSPADDERGAALAGSERLVRCWEWIGRAERLCGLAGEGGRRRRIRRDPAGRLAGEEPRRLLRLGGREAAGDSVAVGGGGHGDVRSVLPSLSCDVYDSPMRR